jgi:hypothetical protein
MELHPPCSASWSSGDPIATPPARASEAPAMAPPRWQEAGRRQAGGTGPAQEARSCARFPDLQRVIIPSVALCRCHGNVQRVLGRSAEVRAAHRRGQARRHARRSAFSSVGFGAPRAPASAVRLFASSKTVPRKRFQCSNKLSIFSGDSRSSVTTATTSRRAIKQSRAGVRRWGTRASARLSRPKRTSHSQRRWRAFGATPKTAASRSRASLSSEASAGPTTTDLSFVACSRRFIGQIPRSEWSSSRMGRASCATRRGPACTRSNCAGMASASWRSSKR